MVVAADEEDQDERHDGRQDGPFDGDGRLLNIVRNLPLAGSSGVNRCIPANSTNGPHHPKFPSVSSP